MKKFFYILKKRQGFVGIETILVSGIVVFAGIIAFNHFFGDTYSNMLSNNIKPTFENFIE